MGALIERVSNESFLHYMKHNLFTPLGMEATKGEFNDPLLYNRARYGLVLRKLYVVDHECRHQESQYWWWDLITRPSPQISGGTTRYLD